jgi:hypothetical protein
MTNHIGYFGYNRVYSRTYVPAQNWLQIAANVVATYTTSQHANVGDYLRGSGSYVSEILMDFRSVFDLSGKYIESASLQVSFDEKGSQIVGADLKLFEQNLANPTTWSDPPAFDDFDSLPFSATWTNELDSISGALDPGTYTFTDDSNNLRDYVQSWADNSSDNWGLVVGINFGAVGQYLRSQPGTTILTVEYREYGN